MRPVSPSVRKSVRPSVCLSDIHPLAFQHNRGISQKRWSKHCGCVKFHYGRILFLKCQRTYGQTDRPSYRNVRMHLKVSDEAEVVSNVLRGFFLCNCTFLDATTLLYKRSCLSVRRSIRPSVHPSVYPVLFLNDR